LEAVVESRIATANDLTTKLLGIPGIETPRVGPKSVHTYWKYCLRVDSKRVRGGAVKLAQLLAERGIASAPRYIQKPAFMCEVFQKQRTFGNNHYPFTLARPEAIDYDRNRFPGTFDALEGILVLPWNERYTDQHVNYIAGSLKQCVKQLSEEV
jgi:dTDP-4-amino-4,6-dideoxygalactose transaminase